MLTSAGAGMGAALAFGGVELLIPFAERLTPRASEIRVGPGAILFAAVLAVAWLDPGSFRRSSSGLRLGIRRRWPAPAPS